MTPYAVHRSLGGVPASGRRDQEGKSARRRGGAPGRRYKLKVCLLGDHIVGKTSLIRRFVQDEFDERYLYTLGTNVSKKDVLIEGESGSVSVKLMIWDIMGHAGFSDLLAGAYFEGADGVLAVADLTREDTLENLQGWIASAKKVAGDIPVVVLANKSDLAEDAEILEGDISEVASSLGGEYYITSAKTGENVDTAFENLARTLVRRHSQDFFGG